jgi:hypothetical protein
LCNQLARWAIPELKDRRHETHTRHVSGKTVIGEQIERRRVRGGGAWVRLRAFIHIEQPYTYPASAEPPGAEQSNRTASGNQNLRPVAAHAAFPIWWRHAMGQCPPIS